MTKASYSVHSRLVSSLTALFESSELPPSSRKAAAMSRVDSPRAYISTASFSSARCAGSAVPAGASGTALRDHLLAVPHTQSRPRQCAFVRGDNRCGNRRRAAPWRADSSPRPNASRASASNASSTSRRTPSRINSACRSPAVLPFNTASTRWRVRSDAGTLCSRGCTS